MSLLTGFNISLDEVGLLGQASQAAFVGGNIPAGWTVVTPAELGLDSHYSDGNFFTDPTSGASAIVLKEEQDSSYIVAFRGTDDPIDILHYTELLTGDYIHHYDPLLNALNATAPPDATFAFTGASLGGGATNLMANIAGSAFGGRFAAATFVGLASPTISTAAGILNIGFENDPIYKTINFYADFPSSLDNLVLATSQYMAGNYDGFQPPDDYAHSSALGLDAWGRVAQSVFYDFMTPDSVLIFDANAGLVQDVTPGRESTGAFYFGENVADSIAGRNGSDFLEGFGGNDFLEGFGGDDFLFGGAGDDFMVGGTGDDVYVVDNLGDVITENAPDGSDVAVVVVSGYTLGANVEHGVIGITTGATLTGNGEANALFGNAGNDTLNGLVGDDFLDGQGGADTMAGGAGDDVYVVDNLGDVITENAPDGSDFAILTISDTLDTNVENLLLADEGGAINGTGNSGANGIIGNVFANVLNGAGGVDAIIGGGGNDTFVFQAGQANGDIVIDLAGNGAAAGDSLEFHGYGTAAEGATLTQTVAQIDTSQWTIHAFDNSVNDVITLLSDGINRATVHSTDFIFL